MSWLPRSFFRIFGRRRNLYNDLAEEMREHIEEKTEQFIREGMNREEATHAARRAFGNEAVLEQRGREAWQWPRIENLLRDLTFSARLLRKSPGFALIAILTLTLGVGANTAVFSLLNGLLLRPLPVPDAHQLVLIRIEPTSFHYSFSAPLFRELEKHHEVFSSVFAFTGHQFQIRGQNGNETISGSMVSGQFFEGLKTLPQLGRYLTPNDDRKGASENPIVISDDFWKTRFNRDPGIIGRKLVLDNVTFTIAGVMPKTFIGADANNRPQVYVPLVAEPLVDAPYDMTAGGYHSWWLRVGARLKPGVSLAQANALLRSIGGPIFIETIPDPKWTLSGAKRADMYFVAEPGSAGYSYLRTRYRDPLLLTFALCVVVLLLACINLASLLLARAAMRQREIATRLAIGATRRRLIQQLLVDSLLLAFLGTAAGLMVAPLVSRVLVAMLVRGQSLLYLDTSIDWRVFLFAAIAAIFSTVLIGLLPALQATAGDLTRHIKEGSHAAHAERRRILPKVLLATEVALAMVLVSGAGLLSASLVRLYKSGIGFDPHGLLLVDLDMNKQALDGDPLSRLYHDLVERFAHLPGVTSASLSGVTPLSGSSWTGDLHLPGGTDREMYESRVAPDYFRTMRIPLLAGREFTWADNSGSGLKVILNEAAAKMLFPSGDAVGKQVRENEVDDKGVRKENVYEVVAVVGNTKYTALRDAVPPTAYYAVAQSTEKKPSYTAILRVSGSLSSHAAPLAASLRRVVAELAPEIPQPVLSTMEGQVDDSVAAERVMALLSVFFAACALLVTAIGLYGVLSYSTARRTSEIGIRMALGAERAQVVSLIFRENAWVAVTGSALGLLVAALASRALATFLYGTSPRDPWVLSLSLAMLWLISAVASIIPALRAASIDPMKALRTE
jgi:predicted permease